MLRLLSTLLALAVALTGCVSIAEESARQLDVVGDVELTTVICAAQSRNAPTCPATQSNELSTGTDHQVLLAHRIPSQSAPPETVSATDVPLTLSRSMSYAAELQRLAPAPAGQQWVGYISPPFAYSVLQSEQSATMVARIMLVRDANGAPFPSPFHYRTIVGYRQAREDPNRPVSCGEVLEHTSDGTNCMTYPAPDQLESDVKVPTRDLGILAGAAGSAPRGGSGVVPFTVAYSGQPPAPSFALAATTTVPGGTVAAPPSVAGAGVVPVTVTVPGSTAPGIYEVALAATLPNGQSRHASGLVRVTGDSPVDRAPPELAVRMKTRRPRTRRALKLGLVADVSCSEACRVTAQIRAGRRGARRLGFLLAPGVRSVMIGSLREKRHADGRRNVRVRFTRGMGPRLVRVKRLRLTMRVRARDPYGNTRRRSVGFTLRR